MSHSDPMDALRQDPEAARLLRDPAALRRLLSGPQAQALAALLRQAGGENLRDAAVSAAKGDGGPLSSILSKVAASPDGARAMEDLSKQAES